MWRADGFLILFKDERTSKGKEEAEGTRDTAVYTYFVA